MSPSAQAVAERRPAYLTELARGTEGIHEPRRPDCPWCGSTKLGTRLRTTDLLQHKPGTFTIDQCRSCAHSFQNPRLTPEGLNFYYRDFYDGLGADQAERIFGAQTSTRRHRAATHALAHFLEPEAWLDVGTGHARFPAAAKEVPCRTRRSTASTSVTASRRAAARPHRGGPPRLHSRTRAPARGPLRRDEHVPATWSTPSTRARNSRRPTACCAPAATC
ncbi:hypothetical protein [Streptomyces sp. KL116D]|uniref:hypothetical protein n=1 Tax=Streptomyces sp. KL116D TaxID=3045152 RepID=UPI0035564DB3